MTDTMIKCVFLLVALLCATSDTCEIIENMSCKCHTSFAGDSEQLICNNYQIQINSSIKLTNETLQTIRSFDTFHLTFYDQELNVSAMFINDLSYLFPRGSFHSSHIGLTSNFNRPKVKPTLKITLSFPNFVQLHFEDYAFYQLFGDRSDSKTIFTLELTSNGQISFSPMAFNHLKVDQMIVHSSSLEPFSFEEIFNNTQIGELLMEGFTPRSNETLKTHFNGKIQSAKFTKMVESVSNEEFPQYPVRSMTIEAHEARKINASTFTTYRNLHGFHLIRPKFFFDNRSFDGFQYLTSLETVELDAETIKDHTFQHVSRIRSLILGQNIRYLFDHSLDHLNFLETFDVSKVVLDQLYPSARCILARFIEKQHKINPRLVIVPPQAEYCDCIYDFILTILRQKADQNYLDLCENNQQERCQLSECDVVKNFRLPIVHKETDESNNGVFPSIVETIVDAVTPFDSIDDQQATTHHLPSYVHRQPSPMENINSLPDNQISQTSALKGNEPNDPNAIPTDDYDDDIEQKPVEEISPTHTISDEEVYRIAMKNETYKWISLSLVCITILAILFVGTLVWFFTCRPRRRNDKKSGNFQRVEHQPNGSHV